MRRFGIPQRLYGIIALGGIALAASDHGAGHRDGHGDGNAQELMRGTETVLLVEDEEDVTCGSSAPRS
jgi:hypothetical protein